jgi:hypothetical protein
MIRIKVVKILHFTMSEIVDNQISYQHRRGAKTGSVLGPEF